jgi:DNA polymerase III subunit alpha
MGDTDKMVKYMRDAADHGIKVRGPDVSHSGYIFTALGDEIVFGLGGIKGVGQAAVEAIIEARESLPDKKFKDVLQFFETVDLRRVNKKVIECLIKAGAFDNLSKNRAQLMAGFETLLEAAEGKRRDREVGQVSLFDTGETSESAPIELPAMEEWPRSRKLALEKEVLGFYISDHPLNGLDSVLKNRITCLISGLPDRAPKTKVTLGGIVGGLKEFITKKGTRMAFAQLEDQSGVVELVIFSEPFARHQNLLREGRPLIVMGQHEREADVSKILAEDFMTIDALAQKASELIVKITHAQGDFDVAKIADIFTRHKGSIRSRIDLKLPDIRKEITLELGHDFHVNPSEAFFEDLERHLGSNGLAILQ